jgi:hypothetical protein
MWREREREGFNFLLLPAVCHAMPCVSLVLFDAGRGYAQL